MPDLITTGTSGYATGSIDTATVLVNNVSPTDAKHPNGLAAAVVQIEGILGSGTTLIGSAADLGARLAIGIGVSGTLNLSTNAAITGPLNVVKGGTGFATATAGGILTGNGTSALATSSAGTTGQVLISGGTGVPTWASPFFPLPTSCVSGSTRTHEGTFTSATGNLSGIHYYTDFTLNSGHTLTVPAGKRRLVIIATGTITIYGTINASGAGGAAGASGTDQPGKTGDTGIDAGGYPVNIGGSGGTALVHGVDLGTGPLTGSDCGLLSFAVDAMGGAGGGVGGSGGFTCSAGGGSGGAGGGSIVLIAPTVNLLYPATLITNGTDGAASNGCGSGVGGGGGGGNIYILTRTFTDTGAVFTQVSTAVSGTRLGHAGIRQINLY